MEKYNIPFKSLKKENIIASTREGMIRISLHFYNSPGEVDALRSAFIRHRKTKAT
jgi:selenocysteine lyase/cysteine desulfurase